MAPPMLHLVVLRRLLHTQHPWVASSLISCVPSPRRDRELEQTMKLFV